VIERKTRRAAHIPWLGIWCGIGAAVFYTAANIFLRKLATDADYLPVVWVKALSTTVIFFPWLIAISRTGRRVIPAGRDFGLMVMASVVAQAIGNVGLQIGLGTIGLALVVPICSATMVAGSAFLGWIFLKEHVNRLLALALLVLIGSVFILCGGAEEAEQSMQRHESLAILNISFFAGIVATVITGLAYAILGVSIRKVLRGGVPIQTPLVFVGVVGSIGFLVAMLIRDGSQFLSGPTVGDWLAMLIAGVANSIAFWCLSMSLKLLPVVHVNAINVSQVALAGAFGVILFGEALTIWLTIGITLMVFGFIVLGYSSRQTQSATY
jgi:drug/metabolite transporter (DMT)-like permease